MQRDMPNHLKMCTGWNKHVHAPSVLMHIYILFPWRSLENKTSFNY